MLKQPQTIDFSIGTDGKVTIETKGFTGSACQDTTRPILAALGQVDTDTKTPEFFKTQEAQNVARR